MKPRVPLFIRTKARNTHLPFIASHLFPLSLFSPCTYATTLDRTAISVSDRAANQLSIRQETFPRARWSSIRHCRYCSLLLWRHLKSRLSEWKILQLDKLAESWNLIFIYARRFCRGKFETSDQFTDCGFACEFFGNLSLQNFIWTNFCSNIKLWYKR